MKAIAIPFKVCGPYVVTLLNRRGYSQRSKGQIVWVGSEVPTLGLHVVVVVVVAPSLWAVGSAGMLARD